MAEEQRKKATYADLEALPEHLVGEILMGELIISPRPDQRHGHASLAIGGMLSGDGRPPKWYFLAEPELHLHDDVVVPDLAAWRYARRPYMPENVGITVAPDWVCEVLSPSTARVDRGRKTVIYGREGVEWYWQVDPVARYVEVQRLEAERWTSFGIFGDEPRVRLPPFNDLEIDLSDWWLDEPSP
jgi:Uma2 family endonuclease